MVNVKIYREKVYFSNAVRKNLIYTSWNFFKVPEEQFRRRMDSGLASHSSYLFRITICEKILNSLKISRK
jgi:hypothetical protein